MRNLLLQIILFLAGSVISLLSRRRTPPWLGKLLFVLALLLVAAAGFWGGYEWGLRDIARDRCCRETLLRQGPRRSPAR